MARKSLRRVMALGCLIVLAGFALLAFVPSKLVYFGAHLVLFGPGMAIAGSIGPATLVTRWFDRHRGLALGLVHINLVVAVMPLLCLWLLKEQGAAAVYGMMALLMLVLMLPATLAIRDFPPGAGGNAGSGGAKGADGLTIGQILRQPAFWFLATAASSIIAGIMVLTFSMVQLALGMGFSEAQGASLQAVMSVAGMVGSVLFGWLADRLGGYRGLALLAVDFAVLLGLLMLDLPYAATVVVVGLLGLHGAGMVPNVSRALASSLGAASYSRAFGLSSFLSVPFTALGIGGMTMAKDLTGSYAPGLAGLAVLLLLVAPLALAASRRAVTPA